MGNYRNSTLTPEMIQVLEIQKNLAKTYPQALSMDLSVDPFSMGAEQLSLYMETVRRDYEGERSYWSRGGVEVEQIVERTVVTKYGEIPIQIFYPAVEKRDNPLPAILYIHGGGHIVGSNKTHYRILRSLAAYSGMVVIGIEYSLSPEVKFPVALYQCTDTALWVSTHGEEIGVDTNELFMAGDSCGASLAMGSALRLREQGRMDLLKGLLLYYGGYGLESSKSRKKCGSSLDGMTDEDMEAYSRFYLHTPENKTHRYNALLTNDLTPEFPSACIVVSDQDPLLDDNLALVSQYKQAGITCEYHEYKGILHGFLHYQEILPEADDALKKGAAFLRQLQGENSVSRLN